jgi:hypothetical protein
MHKYKSILIMVAITTLLFLLFIPAQAQYALKSSVFGNGLGVVSGSSNAITSTLGQPFIGVTSNTSNIHQVGFWFYVNLITGITAGDDLLPKKFELMQNYPNPFNPVTKIKYAVPKPTHVRVEIYNVLGQRVGTLVNEEKQPGYYTVDFNASSLASGFYIYRLETGGFNAVKKMIVTK